MTREQNIKALDANKDRTVLQKILHVSKAIGEVWMESRAMAAKERIRHNLFY